MRGLMKKENIISLESLLSFLLLEFQKNHTKKKRFLFLSE